MTAPADCRVIGQWRIVEADPWDRHDIDPVETAVLVNDGHRQTALAPLETGLERSAAQRATSSAAC